jgi:hypothetical protein
MEFFIRKGRKVFRKDCKGLEYFFTQRAQSDSLSALGVYFEEKTFILESLKYFYD